MLEETRQVLEKHGAFKQEYAPIVEAITEAIPAEVPKKMKLTIAASETVLFASHLRRNIDLWDGAQIPINSIMFVLSKSGSGKDSSVNAARKCFSKGYDIINSKRLDRAVELAKEEAMQAGVDMPHLPENYMDFYVKPEDLFTASSSTIKGLTMHFNNLEDSGIGAGFVYTGEISNEIANGNVLELMQFMAEVYDLGKKEIKLIGAKEEQVRSLKNLPVSALFVGSEANILQDQNNKNAFKIEFTSRLARRSFFNFNNVEVPLKQYDSIEAMLDAQITIDNRATEIRKEINEGVKEVTEWAIKHLGKPLGISPQVRKLFEIYKRYNQEVSLTMSPLHSIAIIARQHMQWKVLKMAGAYALFNMNDRIEVEDYIQALNLAETLSEDLANFENELIKEPYQLFSDYMQSITINNKSSVSLHMLRKLGYISGVGRMIDRLKDLCTLASSYDEDGIYTATDNGISYERVVPVDTIYISYKPIDNTAVFKAIKEDNKAALTKAKNIIASQANEGLIVEEITFSDLADLLQGDYVYSPFRFKDGIRLKENLLPGTKWLVLDIDKTELSAEEAHFILSDINHHIALSSNPNNEYKYRVIIELEAIVDLKPEIWIEFYKSIAKELALNVDPLPQSQLFFSYSTSPIYSVTDAEPIKIKEHILYANERAKSTQPPKKLNKIQQSAALSDPMITFNYAYEAKNGEGSRKLIAAALHAKDLGATEEETISLVEDINDYWTVPMEESRFKNTIIKYINRIYNKD